jgi:peptide subunit release factor 1 (eRF1)
MNDHLISRSRFLDALVLDADNKTDLIQVHQALEKAVISPDEVRGVGKWIECVDYDGDSYYECSACHTPFTFIDGTPELNDYHCCPNCGARMKGVCEDG